MMPDHCSFELFCQHYSSEQACSDSLFHARWPDGFCCPACRNTRYYLIRTRRLPLYECQSCGRQTSIIAGTVMESSPTPLTRWFQAVYLLSQPSGISSLLLSKIIQVTYKTAWLMSHKIRWAMQQADSDMPLTGLVRVDHVFYGCPAFPDARHPLLIGGSLDQSDQPKHVKIKQPDPSDVSNESRWIQPVGVNRFVRDHIHTNAVALFARPDGLRHPSLNNIRGNVNRWLNDTFHGIGAKHLQAYLDEFCFRWNLKLRQTCIFSELLHWSAKTPVLVYEDLIRIKPVLPVPWVVWGSKAKWKGHHLTLWYG
jgi:transposase-like protein